MICNTNARMDLERMETSNSSDEPAVPKPMNLVWQIGCTCNNRHHQISFATSLCSSAFPNQTANSLITGSVSVSPITSHLLCADIPLSKQTDGAILHYHPADWWAFSVRPTESGVTSKKHTLGQMKNPVQETLSSGPMLGCSKIQGLDASLRSQGSMCNIAFFTWRHFHLTVRTKTSMTQEVEKYIPPSQPVSHPAVHPLTLLAIFWFWNQYFS